MRIICFGDSWTAGHGVEEIDLYSQDPEPPIFIQKLREQNSWPRFLSEKLDCVYVNNGICGYGNKYIYKDVITYLNSGFAHSEDIVIIMFSYPFRYIRHDSETIIDIFQMLEKKLIGIRHFYFNSFYPSFKDYDFDTKELPAYFINPDGCVSDILRNYEIENDISVWEYNKRSVWNDEKNFYEGDYHPNLLGYRIIGQYIYDSIKNYV